MTKLETLLGELAKTTLNCLENHSDIFLTFRFSPESKIVDLNLQLPEIQDDDESKQKMSRNIAILLYLVTFGQCNDIVANFLEHHHNPIINQALEDLNIMLSTLMEESEQEENKQSELEQEEHIKNNGVKLMPDGSIDPTTVIKLDSL